MTDLVATASLTVAAAAVLVGLLTALRTGQLRSALPIALDFLTAAGLLRLSAQQSWAAIAGAATIIAIRHLLVWAFAQQTRPPGDGPHERRRGRLSAGWGRTVRRSAP